jgi:outer membrane biosynthesis protein TonB
VPITFDYQWARCDAALLVCSPITGATASTYLLVKADIGKRIVATVTATNVVDTTTALADGTTTVLPEAPSNVGPPAVTAATGARDGAKLVASTGTWNGATPMTFTINWLRCEADGTGCGAIPGAIGTNYTLTAEDVGHRMRVRVDGANTTAEIPATSAATAVVVATPPVSTAMPTVVAIEGKPIVGSRVRAETGNWGGTSPVAFDIRWQRCPTSSLACDDVPGATSAEYTLADADIGKRMRVVVTARNAAASAVANSVPTIVVPPVAPDGAVLPTVTGSAREGSELSAGPGAWSGTAPISYAYQWERCANASDVKCTSISGATRTSYTATKADVGSYLRISVSASNGGGKSTRASAVTEKVVGTTATTTVTTTKATTTKATTTKKSTTKKSTTKKKTTVKTSTAKKKTVKKVAVKKKKTVKKKVAVTKKVAVKKKATKKKTVKRTTTKAKTTKKSTSKKTTVKKTAAKKKTKKKKFKKTTANTKKKTTTTTTTANGTKSTPKDTNSMTQPIVQLQRVQITATGSLLLTMSCPSYRTRACGASGTVVAGSSLGAVIPDTTLTFTLADVTVAPRKTITRSFDLTTAQLDELRTLTDVNFQVRLSAPTAPKRVNEVFVHATVPAELLAQAPSG